MKVVDFVSNSLVTEYSVPHSYQNKKRRWDGTLMERFGVLLKRALHIFYLMVTFRLFNDISELKGKLCLAFTENVEDVKDSPLVSVIVPTWNDVKPLSFLLLSIKKQSFQNMEVIVADYQSTDGTQETAKNYGANVLTVAKKGVGYASHRAALHSRGDIIIRTDADALFPRWLIGRVVNLFANFHKIMLIHGSHFYYDAGFLTNLLAHLYDKYWKRPENASGFFIAVRRSAYFDVGGFSNYRYGEDWKFGQSIFRKYGKTSICYDPLNIIVLTSARNIRAKGFMKYLLSETTYHDSRARL